MKLVYLLPDHPADPLGTGHLVVHPQLECRRDELAGKERTSCARRRPRHGATLAGQRLCQSRPSSAMRRSAPRRNEPPGPTRCWRRRLRRPNGARRKAAAAAAAAASAAATASAAVTDAGHEVRDARSGGRAEDRVCRGPPPRRRARPGHRRHRGVRPGEPDGKRGGSEPNGPDAGGAQPLRTSVPTLSHRSGLRRRGFRRRGVAERQLRRRSRRRE